VSASSNHRSFTIRCSFLALFTLFSFLGAPLFSQVKTGADLLLTKYRVLVAGKRVGLITNQTGRLSDGRFLADVLHKDPDVTLAALFGPEHGIRGAAPAGVRQSDNVDSATGVPAYSLYGKNYKPTPAMLKGIDVLLFDIQDVGARFYTYISTLSYAMEAAAEQGIPFVVLDRPNPIRGTWVEGFGREDSLRSFVGLQPIPIVHGMTVGELATMYNNEGWLAGGIHANLTVVKMEGWKRNMWYDQTGLPWISPSPNIPTIESAVVYPGMCLVEGTNLSEGRGTVRPFEYISAPYVDGKKLAAELNAAHLPGVRFEPMAVTPVSIPGASTNPKYKGEECGGVFVHVTDRNVYEPVKAGVYLIAAAKKLYPHQFRWRSHRGIDRLAGTPRFRQAIDEGWPPERIAGLWKMEVKQFRTLRAASLLYP